MHRLKFYLKIFFACCFRNLHLHGRLTFADDKPSAFSYVKGVCLIRNHIFAVMKKKNYGVIIKFVITGHHGTCCNPFNWESRNWIPTFLGNPKGPCLISLASAPGCLTWNPKG